MKIEGTGKTQSSGKTSSKGKVSQSGSGFGDMLAKGTEESSGASMTSQVASLDALLMVQDVDDAASRASKGRMKVRAGKILEELDNIRNSMLTGELTVGNLIDLADVVASHREKIDDPELIGIMDEIDLRANVEIAKLTSQLRGRKN